MFRIIVTSKRPFQKFVCEIYFATMCLCLLNRFQVVRFLVPILKIPGDSFLIGCKQIPTNRLGILWTVQHGRRRRSDLSGLKVNFSRLIQNE